MDGDGSSKRAFKELLGQVEPDDNMRAAVALTTRERFDSIGVGKASVRKVAVDCFDVTADQLKSWESELGSLPDAVEKAANYTERLMPRTSMSLAGLWSDLVAIDNDDVDDTDRLMRNMIGDYEEPKWVAHALLGKNGCTTGMTSKSVTSVVSDMHGLDIDDRRLRALNPDTVELVLSLEREGATAIETEPSVGKPFKPMLAKSKEVPEDFDELLVQRKYDGARLLAHVHEDGSYQLFSRNTKEVTDSLPEFDEVVENMPTGEFILDGEAVPYKDGEQVDFQHVMTRFNRKDDIEEQEVDIQFRFFDLVYCDIESDAEGGDMSREDNRLRLYYLYAAVFRGNKDYVADNKVIDTHDELMSHFQSTISAGYEGLIVKSPDAEYEFDRRSPNWKKMVQNNENADLRIIEVIEGEDNQAGACGALRLETEDGHTVGKVGTGFGSDVAYDLWERRDEVVGQICEISWRDLQKNEDDTYAVRFPAFESMRPDKDEADTLQWLKDEDAV